MKHNIVLGPPGTGKTTYLLNTVDKLFTDGVRPYELGYLAFTKKAANEALSRAMKNLIMIKMSYRILELYTHCVIFGKV